MIKRFTVKVDEDDEDDDADEVDDIDVVDVKGMIGTTDEAHAVEISEPGRRCMSAHIPLHPSPGHTRTQTHTRTPHTPAARQPASSPTPNPPPRRRGTSVVVPAYIQQQVVA